MDNHQQELAEALSVRGHLAWTNVNGVQVRRGRLRLPSSAQPLLHLVPTQARRVTRMVESVIGDAGGFREFRRLCTQAVSKGRRSA